jgi:Fe-S oxidoreductase
MNTIHHAQSTANPQANAQLIDSLTDVFACSGCMACERHCELGIPVNKTLRSARAALFASGNLPTRVQRFAAQHDLRAQKLARAALGLHTHSPTPEPPAGDPRTVVLFVGCSTAVFAPERAIRAQRVLSKKLAVPVPVHANACCGLPALELGDEPRFAAQSARIHNELAGAGCVIALDPGCAHASRVLSASKVPMLTLVELAEQQRWLTEGVLKDELSAYAWHDPCRLGRGLGVTQAPRALLTRATQRAPRELAQRESEQLCSGGGGLLPVSHPETASKITSEMRLRLQLAGVSKLVTGCPTAQRRFVEHAIDATLLDDWIIAGLEKSA